MTRGFTFLDTRSLLLASLLGLLGGSALLLLVSDLLFLLLGLEDVLDNLLFLNQKGTHDAVADAGSAARTTISTGDGALTLGDT